MNVQFQDAAREVETTESIFVNGEKVGSIECKMPDGTRRYHACIKFPGSLGLIQGFADTKEEAITNALTSGHKEATRLLSQIAELKGKLFTEKG